MTLTLVNITVDTRTSTLDWIRTGGGTCLCICLPVSVCTSLCLCFRFWSSIAALWWETIEASAACCFWHPLLSLPWGEQLFQEHVGVWATSLWLQCLRLPLIMRYHANITPLHPVHLFLNFSIFSKHFKNHLISFNLVCSQSSDFGPCLLQTNRMSLACLIISAPADAPCFNTMKEREKLGKALEAYWAFSLYGSLICSLVPATFSVGSLPGPPARPIITNPPSHLSCHFPSAAKEACVAKGSCSLLTGLGPDWKTVPQQVCGS